MGWFQDAPRTPEELERSRPLDIPPERVLEFDEAEWYARAYRGDDVPQLTLRAVLTGLLLGFILAFTNVYVGLKTGWELGIAITACIVSFSVWSLLHQLGAVRTPMTILENNCMQSTASAAGYSTGSTIISAFPALLLTTVTLQNPGGTHLPMPLLMAWIFFTGAIGVIIAIPMKRNLINQEKLRFPSGTAAAVTLQSLYGKGAEAIAKARALMGAAAFGLVLPLLFGLNIVKQTVPAGTGVRTTRTTVLPDSSPIFNWLGRIHGYTPQEWTMRLDHSALLIAAGAIVGLRVSLSMLIGGLVMYLWVGPMAMDWTNAAGLPFPAVSAPGVARNELGVWIGAPMMVAAGLTAFLMQWKTIVRAFRGIRGAGAGSLDAQRARAEVPNSWFALGLAVTGLGVILLAQIAFGIPWYFGVLAVLLTMVLSLVASRATGETDITPIGPMGKITQLAYGILMPQNASANLLTASITSGAAIGSADLLTDLKSGYLLGANPRRQFLAQFFGVFAGAVATVIGFHILIPDATKLVAPAGGKAAFDAPSAWQWKAVADLFTSGVEHLHPLARWGIAGGLAVGIVLTVLEYRLPRLRRWLPSATGLGFGFLLSFASPLAFFLGALAAYLVERADRARGERYIIPVASGLIAGESLMGVVVAALNNFVLV